MLSEATKEISNSSYEASETTSEGAYKTVTIDNLYQLDVPKYMKDMPSLHPDASLEYANIYKETYSVVIHEDKQYFVDVFKEIDEYNDSLSVLENYTIVQKKSLKESLIKPRIQDYGLSEINGIPARQIKVFGTVEGIDAFYIIAFVEGKDNLYMIMNWTLENRKDKYENAFEYINGTFKII
ncbi:hypothetical protein GCM10011444_18310 [Winogradskyella haliclonae]|uniref:Uncharacterized protein n=2 Tax=Winogradskyella haliclonae TaxID=2048558 RepID=A0ABQ2C171_9FLAO|nr:hypothetical protein GCM10011444_18310 [Winogradskyella haliclonae]